MTPGRGDVGGTGRNNGSSGPDGSARNRRTSPRTLPVPSPMPWYGSVRRGTRCFRDLGRHLDRTRPSRRVTGHRQCADLVKTPVGQLPGVPQLRLTGGPYRSYVLNVRPTEAVPMSRSPRLFPRDRGLRSALTPHFRTPCAAFRSPTVTVRSGSHLLPPRQTSCAAPFGGRDRRGYHALGATYERLCAHRNSGPRHGGSIKEATG